MAAGWSMSAFRWLDFDFSVRSSVIRWPGIFASYIVPPWLAATASSRWSPRRLMVTGWSNLLSLSIVDDFVWGVVTAFESVALVSMLCFFFLFCGCTI